ncbi:ferredoxin [Arthrobacter sp. KFRI-F3372]|uniref:ferredoxin n=1 Tax=Micrococcaceae TaxID=1268 RepID=UPI00278B5EA8|nr:MULTISPECIES: ferredoxin [Micrococcaceae]MDP9988351.1 ferredoxin [Arthrobacter oryzae]MEE2523849.1 ferredoxin [Pseudarthrobacter sp. J47]MEE2530279.1 ferredoxin [Pseudarthrobacter sp. J75]WHP61019.1 ferredoxin [Arthrobacter sp. KFRI-F3372]
MSFSPRTPRPGSALPVLAVDRIACTGHGVCATLLPEHITLDEWGYPILDGPIPKTADAELAVRYCPARALYWRNRNA